MLYSLDTVTYLNLFCCKFYQVLLSSSKFFLVLPSSKRDLMKSSIRNQFEMHLANQSRNHIYTIIVLQFNKIIILIASENLHPSSQTISLLNRKQIRPFIRFFFMRFTYLYLFIRCLMRLFSIKSSSF